MKASAPLQRRIAGPVRGRPAAGRARRDRRIARGGPGAHYQPPGWLRDAVIARDLVDTAPGSTVPARYCDLDHRQAFDAGGPTDGINLAPAGRTPHGDKTDGNVDVTRARDGTVTWTWTSGYKVARPPTRRRLDQPAPPSRLPPRPPPPDDRRATHPCPERGRRARAVPPSPGQPRRGVGPVLREHGATALQAPLAILDRFHSVVPAVAVLRARCDDAGVAALRTRRTRLDLDRVGSGISSMRSDVSGP